MPGMPTKTRRLRELIAGGEFLYIAPGGRSSGSAI